MTPEAEHVTDGRRVRGARTRQAILSRAARLASAEGLEAVSLQRLAGDLGMSKSGLFAHFGSKEELQLAIVDEGSRIFTDEVLRPGLKTPAGLARVWAMSNAFLSYLERQVFPGGCFFEATVSEFDSKPGRVRDAVVEKRDYWVASLGRAVRAGMELGEIEQDVDADQIAWELSCLLVGANGSFVQSGGNVGLERARRAIRDRLERIATPAAPQLPTN